MDGKRLVDLAVAVPGLLLALPVLAVAAGLVWLVDGRPVLFCQARDGKDGRRFTLLKLRTMHRNAEELLSEVLAGDTAMMEEWSRFYRLEGDPRLLPRVGPLLRRTSVDELPQLWNVIRGDMSLVGPRPLAVDIVEILDPAFLAKRRRLKPGLTGLWQVQGRSDNDIAELERLDDVYLRHRSLRMDVSILARTPLVVLRGTGAY